MKAVVCRICTLKATIEYLHYIINDNVSGINLENACLHNQNNKCLIMNRISNDSSMHNVINTFT